MRRMWRRLLIVLLVLGGAHAYIWWRLIDPLPSPWRALGTIAMLLGPISLPAGLLTARRLPRATAAPILLAIHLWFALACYLLVGAAASHVAVALGANARTAAVVAGLGAVATVALGAWNVRRGPRVRRVEVPMPALARDAYTIVQLTDVHLGPHLGREFAARVVRDVLALDPDLVVITGDLIDGHLSELQAHVEPLAELRARDGVFAVTGNHEHYWEPELWLEHLGSLGIRVLRNEHVVLGGGLALAGVEDAMFGEDVARAVHGRDPSLPLVLLAHHPRTALRAQRHGVDLQLSGHTHGGQLLPLGWLARLFDPVVAGLRRVGATWVYVSEGTGYWGPPVRVGTTQEIAAITLRGGARPDER
jgi:predicted MPP superfamily phosphohydrolase